MLPLTHKSGLNISGRFNVQKNNTGIENIQGDQSQEYKLYKNFWKLHNVLTQPHQLFQQTTKIDLDDLDEESQQPEDYDEDGHRRDSAEESGAIPDDFIEPKKGEEIECGQILESCPEITIKKAVSKMKQPVSLLLQILVQIEAIFIRF